MAFPYREYIGQVPGSSEFRLILRPVITIGAAGPAAEARVDALVDTGADDTLLPVSLARLLGVALDNCPTSIAAGVTGDRMTIYYGDVRLTVSDDQGSFQWNTLVGFVEFESSEDEVIVLGHGGFLDYFTATFRGEEAEVELAPNRLLDLVQASD